MFTHFLRATSSFYLSRLERTALSSPASDSGIVISPPLFDSQNTLVHLHLKLGEGRHPTYLD